MHIYMHMYLGNTIYSPLGFFNPKKPQKLTEYETRAFPRRSLNTALA
jgi:hypothetical protein